MEYGRGGELRHSGGGELTLRGCSSWHLSSIFVVSSYDAFRAPTHHPFHPHFLPQAPPLPLYFALLLSSPLVWSPRLAYIFPCPPHSSLCPPLRSLPRFFPLPRSPQRILHLPPLTSTSFEKLTLARSQNLEGLEILV